MTRWKILLTAVLIPALLSAGSGSDSKSAQSSTRHSSSSQKGKNKMPTQSPMLNEIFSSNHNVAIGEYKDVGYIVTKYIPIGTSKEEVKNILDKMHQNFKEEGHTIYAGYGVKTHPMTPKPSVQIELQFNNSNFLENIEAKLTTLF